MGCLVKLREGYIDYVSADLKDLIKRAPRSFEQFARDHAHLLFPDAVEDSDEVAFEPTVQTYS